MDIDDQNTTLEAGINAYVDAIRGRDAAQRGQKGKLKFSNKKTADDDEMDMEDDGAEAEGWQQARKAKSGSGMGRGGLKNGRPGLGAVKQRNGNVSDGGGKSRVEKNKSPRGRGGFKVGRGRGGRGGGRGDWIGPK
jgi:ribosomal RNA-processing protein 12